MPACSWLFEKLDKQSNSRPLLPAPAWVSGSHPAGPVCANRLAERFGGSAAKGSSVPVSAADFPLLFNDMSG
jgi:hypothetical protein